MPAPWVLISTLHTACHRSRDSTNQHEPATIDPAALNPLEELCDDIIYNVEILVNLWLDHPPEELRRTVEAQLQQLFSCLPWLLSLLPPLVQDFLRRELHLHPATATCLPCLAENILLSPAVRPSGRKCRSRRRRLSLQLDPCISELW